MSAVQLIKAENTAELSTLAFEAHATDVSAGLKIERKMQYCQLVLWSLQAAAMSGDIQNYSIATRFDFI